MRRNRASQANVRSTTHRCRPRWALLSTPRRAMRGRIPRARHSWRQRYTFSDNHDVDRVASVLAEPAHLYPLAILLMTMPGIPSIYYGSEWGMEGRRTLESDAALRPALRPDTMRAAAAHPNLFRVFKNLIQIRHEHDSLRLGDYKQLHVASEQFGFSRGRGPSAVMVAVNGGSGAGHA